MIKFEGVSKSYGKQRVLKEISIEFNNNDCIALIGPNGSGKTTLLKTILSLVLPDSGSIWVNGINTKEDATYRKYIGYMPQMSRLPANMKVIQLFQMLKSVRKDVNPEHYDEELYRLFNIKDMESKTLSTLSGGMRQKVSACLAFLFSPQILILDEPTAALDPVANEDLKLKIQKSMMENKLVLITSHNLNDLDGLINQVVYMMDGKILFRNSLSYLSAQTSEPRLNKMIVKKLQTEGYTWKS